MPKFALLEDEHVKNIYRQSNIFLIEDSFVPLAAAIIPTIVLWHYGLLGQLKSVIFVLVGAASIWFIKKCILWYLTSYVLTNRRLILFYRAGIFNKTVIETPLERVLNIGYKSKGFISAIFDYGNVEVQVVGLVDSVTLKNIPNPAAIKDYLWEMHKRVIPKPIAFDPEDISHFQEKIGYTKKKSKS